MVWSTGRKQIKRFRGRSGQSWIKEQIDGIKEHVVTSKVKLEMPDIIVDGKDWVDAPKPVALDVSLEVPRALHRVWRALNDGDCPKCHNFHAATQINRDSMGIMCPSCGFTVTLDEIEAIEKLFAPAMDAAVKIFESWSKEREQNAAYHNALAYWENEKYMFPESEWADREPKLKEFVK
jgi:hypothetical protein